MPQAVRSTALPPPQKRSARGWLIALLTLVAIVHGPTIFHEFVNWDDGQLVLDNPVLHPVSWQHIGTIWSGPVIELYTPLAYTLWSLVTLAGTLQTPDSQGISLNPLVFHATNVLLHVGSVLVLFDLLRELGRARFAHLAGTLKTFAPIDDAFDRRLARAAFFGAAIFAVHPLLVEPVAWISGMNNCLAGLLSLATIDAYLHAVSPAGRKRTYAITLLLFTLALLSKPTAIVTPILLLAIDYCFLQRRPIAILKSLWPILLLAIPFVIAGRSAQPATDIFTPAWPQRFLIAGDTIGFYLGKLFWPLQLMIDYGRSPTHVLDFAWWPPTVLLTLTAASIALVQWRRTRVPAGVLAIWIGGVAILLGLKPFSFQLYSTTADRYVYLSMLAPAAAMMFALLRWSGRTAHVIAVSLILLLSGLSIAQARMWTDSHSLANGTYARNPTSLVGLSVLAYVAEADGDHAAHEHWLRQGLIYFPLDPVLNYNLGNLLMKDRPAEAIVYFNRAFNVGFKSPKLLNNWGVALLSVGDTKSAVGAFSYAVTVDSNDTSARMNLAKALVRLGDLGNAIAQLQQILRIDPNNAEAASAYTNLQHILASGVAPTSQPIDVIGGAPHAEDLSPPVPGSH